MKVPFNIKVTNKVFESWKYIYIYETVRNDILKSVSVFEEKSASFISFYLYFGTKYHIFKMLETLYMLTI